jgi:hypothetical protein
VIEGVQGPVLVPEPYQIQFAEGAEDDIRSMTAFGRRLILDGLERHLAHQPTQPSRRIKGVQSRWCQGFQSFSPGSRP